jgi:phospholipase/carboxylesterase
VPPVPPADDDLQPDARLGVLQARPDATMRAAGWPGGVHHPFGSGGPLLFLPSRLDATPAPLVLLLHGAGGRPAQMLPFLEEEAERRGVILLAPKSAGPTWDVIRDGFGPDVEAIDIALDATFSRFPVDPARVAVGGFSDGASYALSLGVTNGDLFTRVLAFSPGFLASRVRSGRPSIFVSHGTGDPVLPIDRTSRRLVPRLREEGYEVDYREFPGRHEVPAEQVRAALEGFA